MKLGSTRGEAERSTRGMIEWGLRQDGFRNRGRPPMRWTEDVKRVAGNWNLSHRTQVLGGARGRHMSSSGRLGLRKKRLKIR